MTYTTEIYFLTVPEARKSDPCSEGSREEHFSEVFQNTSFKVWWLQASLGVEQYKSNLYLCLHKTISSPMSVFKFPSSFKDTSVWIRAHSNAVWIHISLIKFAKTLFPNKDTVWGSGQTQLNPVPKHTIILEITYIVIMIWIPHERKEVCRW